jgi:serine protease AprX
MPLFTSNFPSHQPGSASLLSTPERTGAILDYTGRGVVMAFIDAGFYPHPDLGDRILVHVDASTNRVIEQPGHDFSASDHSWHGQMTSVIACGDGRTSGGKYQGLASDALLVLVKVSTPRGQVKERDILRGLRWVFDTRRRFHVRIVNISVGGDLSSSDPDHPLHQMVRKLTQAGIVVVIAAGNRSVPYLLPPASAPDGITVGGIDDHNSADRADWRLYHHNYGTAYNGSAKPDLLAPAAWIASPILPGSSVAREARWLAPLLAAPDHTVLQNVLGQGYGELGLPRDLAQKADASVMTMLQQRIHAHKLVDEFHQHVDGTSVAAPIVASIIAQMLEANPGLTPERIRAILTATARRLPDAPIEQQGAGVVDAAQAVRMAASLS